MPVPQQSCEGHSHRAPTHLESLCEFNVENEVNLAEEDIAKKRKDLSNAERHVCAMERIKTYCTPPKKTRNTVGEYNNRGVFCNQHHKPDTN